MGTLDELFEVLTLKQTGKVQTDLPVVLFGKRYWKSIINWEAIAEFGVISEKDVEDLFFADTGESPRPLFALVGWMFSKRLIVSFPACPHAV